jgi:prephenate dehydrogenase
MKALNCVAIAGVGLIGGSVGLAVRSRNLAKNVVGFGSQEKNLAAALQMGAISGVASDPRSAVAQADLVVVCAPVGHIVEQVRRIAALCRAGTLITDVGSTKEIIVGQLEQAAETDAAWRPEVRFVGSHPLAGSEKRGSQHAEADLFVGRIVIVTPTPRTRPDDTQAVSDFWRSLGATVREMSASEHDRAMAATSHLPHLIAAAIAGSTPEEYVTLAASGWQDTTRIAAGDHSLWRQIMVANRANLLAALQHFSGRLDDWRKALEANDGPELDRLLREAKRIRDAVGS